MRSLLFFFFVIVFCIGLNGQQKIKGITVVAPPSPIGSPEMNAVQAVNSNWIALVPYGFSSPDQPSIRFNLDRQWWGEKEIGIRECISKAHENGIKVMLKPQVYIHGSWVGYVSFDNEKDWTTWENAYSEYIEFYARLAAETNVELFCVGTEYKTAVQKRPDYWKKLIRRIRSYYNGKIIYSSNWDGYDKVPIWDELDYVGISAYFPLTDQKTPRINKLLKHWKPIRTKLEKFARKVDKPIVFTEYGYMSIDGPAGKAWEIEKRVRQSKINEKAQANAYHAILKTFWKEDWWAGAFLWKWFPAGMGHEGYPEKDYTPQDKLAEEVIKDWYGKN